MAALLAIGYRAARPPQPQPAPAPNAQSPGVLPGSPPAPLARSVEGDALWRQSLQASGPKGTPIQAHVTITRSSGAVPERTEFDLSDGGGRYRLSYIAPQSARGRIVVCDGKTLWQYEPIRRTVLRRSLLPNDAASPLGETELPAGVIAEIEGKVVSAGGRPAQVLAFRDAKGALLSRRWLDTATRRSLRSETYNPQTGKRLVQVELTGLQPLLNPDPALFQPDFPGTARVLKASAARSPDLTEAAQRAGLPVMAGTYRLRSVLRSHSAIPTLTADSADHLLYSNGIDTVSVFAAIKAAESTALSPGRNWQTVSLSPGTPAFVRTDRQGRTAIAWMRDGKRLVAVSRLPQSELLSMARSLVVTR